MSSPSYTYTFSNGSVADASQVNQNFTDILNGVTDGTKDLSISALTCAGTATLNGDINLGNAGADTLSITASLGSSIAVKTTDTYVIGDATHVLSNLFSTRHALGDGLVGTPALYFTADTNTGIYRIGTDEIGIATNGVLNVDITAANGTKIRGTTTNDAAATGFVGEYVSSTISSLAGQATNTWENLTNISLTAGDWFISGLWRFRVGTASDIFAALSINSGATTTDHVEGANAITSYATTLGDIALSIPQYRLSISGTTTVYIKMKTTSAGGSCLGGIRATRPR